MLSIHASFTDPPLLIPNHVCILYETFRDNTLDWPGLWPAILARLCSGRLASRAKLLSATTPPAVAPGRQNFARWKSYKPPTQLRAMGEWRQPAFGRSSPELSDRQERDGLARGKGVREFKLLCSRRARFQQLDDWHGNFSKHTDPA